MLVREGGKDQNRGWETCIGHSESFSASVKPGRTIIGRTDVYGRCLQMLTRVTRLRVQSRSGEGIFGTPYDNRRWRRDESDGDRSSQRGGYASVCAGVAGGEQCVRSLSSDYRSLLAIRGLFLQKMADWQCHFGTKNVRYKFASSRARCCKRFKWCYRPALG